MTILIATMSEDGETVDAVMAALRREGCHPYRLDTDLFPTRVSLSAWHEGTWSGGRLDGPAGTLALGDISAVWHRRWRTGADLARHLAGDVLRGAEAESEMSLQGVVGALRCFHFDRPDAVARARNRALQLELAAELGLATPRTLTTNDPAEARSFVAAGEPVVAKMLSAFSVRSPEGEDQVVMTNELDAAAVEALGSLVLCPMTFQEKIEKAVELRITIVGFDVYAAAIDSHRVPGAAVDWRRAIPELREHWTAYELPAGVATALLALLDRLGMNYGAIDMIVTPDGRHVFLEVNPVGQFYWIERTVGYPISTSIAGLLSGRLPPRVAPDHRPRGSEALGRSRVLNAVG